MKKYELTDETKNIFGRVLHRIRACVDINNVVKTGDLGGWVESEANLSHNGDAQVYGDARVCGDAWDKSPLYIQGTKWSAYMTDRTHIQIGCQNHSISDWIGHGVTIARRCSADNIVAEYMWYVIAAAMQYGSADEQREAMQLIESRKYIID